MIDPKTAHQHAKYCNDRGIRIYPLPEGSDHRIVVERTVDGKAVPKTGTMVYRDGKDAQGGCIWNKIRELYAAIYKDELQKENINQPLQE